MTPPGEIDFKNLTLEEFERRLPELFANADGKVSGDSRLEDLFTKYPDCLALVRDLETIADTARSLLVPVEDPSDSVWTNIQNKLREENGEIGYEDDPQEPPHLNGKA
ncbi:MAG TPA: hypothetical protein VII58_07540 [Acidobacteriaceae bacterium]